ncbi:DUF3034 family protein [Sphingomonas panacisoli]|uniref:DUF3034 family protein n=1 Tax=Sphingomonas panacisoli TaxID=1813879 RepID=A0A5B8LFI7_9SPHN|nr:DUF3034 family protein [Sphingomonas panacisoli]QDZ06823.1 DUF3034 family protein [Sphingomonas panacisoli]
MRTVKTYAVTIAIALLAAASSAHADEMRSGGKLVLTGGVTSVEGAAGGGLATWAVITGNETDAGIGASVNITDVPLTDFNLTAIGGKIGWRDRVEVSFQHITFDTRKAGAALGLGRNFRFDQNVIGAKVRIIGDAVYDQDRILPQIAIGVQYKLANQGAIIRAVGGRQSRGTDFYVAATKVVLSKSLVLDATMRLTKANQFGLLGFGGDKVDRYRPQFEGSAAVLLTPRLVIGAEYRSKPDNLGFAREQGGYDLFAAWSLMRNITLTAAYTDLGDIATFRSQRGAFLSLQGGF